MFYDALVVYDYITSRKDLAIEKIVAIGGSLGTGVAVYLAAHRKLDGVILFSPYDRIGGGVTQDMLPFIPTHLLFHNRFDVQAYMKLIQTPVLAIIGKDDKVISPNRSFKLLNQLQGERSVEIIPGDHYTIYEEPYSWKVINEFLQNLS